jgi:hypothetical protein
MNLEKNSGNVETVSKLYRNIQDWYYLNRSSEEQTELRELIANEVIDNYKTTQIEKDGVEPTLRPETLNTLLDSMKLVERLKDLPINDEKTHDPKIEAILILSGPGLFLNKNKLKDQYGESPYRWLNRDRILGGIAYARRIASQKKFATEGRLVRTSDLEVEDLEKYAPVIFYNGDDEENAELNQVLENWDEDGWNESFAEKHPIVNKFPYPSKLPYPREKIRIAKKPNYNTREQMIDIVEETGIGGSLDGMKNISISATTLDFIRLGNYLQKTLTETEDTNLKFWAHPIRARSGFSEEEGDTVPSYLLGELERLVHYLQLGHLCDHPYLFENLKLIE